MNLPFFIAKRLYLSREKNFSGFIGKVAVTAVTLSVTVMIVSDALVNGFQREIASKVYGYFGQIHIGQYDYKNSFEENPVSTDQPFYKREIDIDNVSHIQVSAYKPGILKTEDNLEGIVLKGIGKDFKWSFFRDKMVAGNIFSTKGDSVSDKIVVSKYTASRLQLQPGQYVSVHFLQNPPRVRNLCVSGIYNTGLEEFDKQFALIDIRHIQALNGWNESEVSGFEVFLKNPELMNETCDMLNYEVLSADLVARTIQEIYPNIFDWLALQDMNKLIILVLMTIVACINMVTCLLIIILERSSMIGVLKAMGATQWNIRMIFVYNALYIVTAGIIAGNLAGLALCYLQHRFRFIKLPEASYYTPYAPVDINLCHITAIDIATLVICFLVLLLPSYLVSRISPSKVLRFE